MKPYGVRYFVSYHPAECGLPAETAGVLDVINTLTGNVFWYDNDNSEWHKSIYSAESVLKELGNEYEEVDEFDNGYVNTGDLWEQRTRTSLVRRYPNEFEKNLDLTQEESHM